MGSEMCIRDRCLWIVDQASVGCDHGTYIISDHPERALAYTILEFFVGGTPANIDATARIAASATLGRNIRIGPYCIIGEDVTIQDDTWILSGVVIRGPVRIGRGCVIKDGAVVGSEGYGFVKDESGRLVHSPQLGRIVIGDRVSIGARSFVRENFTQRRAVVGRTARTLI